MHLEWLLLVYLLSPAAACSERRIHAHGRRSRRQGHVKMNSYVQPSVRWATTRRPRAQASGGSAAAARRCQQQGSGRATRKVAARGVDGDGRRGCMHAWHSRELTAELAAKRHERRHEIDHRACMHAAMPVQSLSLKQRQISTTRD
jgi:hypothetical protein